MCKNLTLFLTVLNSLLDVQTFKQNQKMGGSQKDGAPNAPDLRARHSASATRLCCASIQWELAVLVAHVGSSAKEKLVRAGT
jgi:hypothetical protein